MLQCPNCKKQADTTEKRGFCVLCTINNFKANGIHCSIMEAVNIGTPLLEHPELIVKMVPME